jgi:ribonuclease G
LKKQILVSVDRGETRVAMLEATGTVAAKKPSSSGNRRRRRPAKPGTGYKVAELYLERRGARSIVGNIYKGRVDNVLAGLEAAFVDIGLEKNGFLHVDEIVLPGVEAPRRGRGSAREGRDITDMLKPGQEIVVQVVKDPLKTKGARLSMELTIAGRYMVYAPFGEGVGVSRRLDDKERERLRKQAAKLDLEGAGAIIRTSALGASREDLERELVYLKKLNEVLQKRVEESRAPALVFQEADLSVRVVRDVFSAEFERAVVDDAKQHHRLVSFFSRTAPDLVERVELWEDPEPMFGVFGIDDVLDSTLSRRVDLPSGGYLMIDYAEALTVIDVNTGSFVGRGKSARLEDTITKTNLEAADEVVRQLRLRDIGGIIVIDFIDMARARNRDAVLGALRKALDEDRTKTFVVEISPLGLVEMTRQNVTDGVREIMTRHCPTCHGEGVIKSEETIAIEFERRMRELASHTEAEAILLQMNPRVSAEFTHDDARPLRAVEDETGKVFVFEGSEGLPLEHFAVLLEGTRDEVVERAIPFRVGEEVHVQIVEPHMYSSGDAVGKVDGYVISVVGGGPYVGEKHLVRIEEAGRTAAVASLIDAEPGPSGATGDGAGPADARGSGRSRSGASGRSRSGGSGRSGSDASTRSRSDASSSSRSDASSSSRSDASSSSRSDASTSSGRDASTSSGRDASTSSRRGGSNTAANGAPDAAGGGAPDASGESDRLASGESDRHASGESDPLTSGEDGLQSKPRRRGRRGGRRRSGVKAASAEPKASSD